MSNPTWWPQTPYPESIFPMSFKEACQRYKEAIPDGKVRTAISGALGRHFWQLGAEDVYDSLIVHGILPEPDEEEEK